VDDARSALSCPFLQRHPQKNAHSRIVRSAGEINLEWWSFGALLTLHIRCGNYDLFCLFCFGRWQDWQIVALDVIFLPMATTWSRVYILVKRIPKGRVMTYGQLARATRLPGRARAAGRAMAACPRGQAIPWHRVLAAGGRIAVREPFASLQRRLLESEGIRLTNGRVPLAAHLWTPPKGSPKRSAQLASKRASKKPSK